MVQKLCAFVAKKKKTRAKNQSIIKITTFTLELEHHTTS